MPVGISATIKESMIIRGKQFTKYPINFYNIVALSTQSIDTNILLTYPKLVITKSAIIKEIMKKFIGFVSEVQNKQIAYEITLK